MKENELTPIVKENELTPIVLKGTDAMGVDTILSWQFAGTLVLLPMFLGFSLYCWLRGLRESAVIKRRKALARALTSAGIFIAYVLVQSEFNYRVLWISVPIAAIVWLNVRNTIHCMKCNASFFNHKWMTERIGFCPSCGQELERGTKEEEYLGDWDV